MNQTEARTCWAMWVWKVVVYFILKQSITPWYNLIHLSYFQLQAWKLWKEGTPLDFVDPKLEGAYSEGEVLRCIQIGLLCVQEDPEERPIMTTVVLMFSSYSVTLGQPQQPAFYNRTSEPEHMMPAAGLNFDHQSTSNQLPLSVNEASITDLYPR